MNSTRLTSVQPSTLLTNGWTRMERKEIMYTLTVFRGELSVLCYLRVSTEAKWIMSSIRIF